MNAELFEYLLRLGDDRLVNGQRLSEWCGHAPILEEDIALANIALDSIGHATAFLKLAGQVEGKGRSEDDLAYFRGEREFKNLQLVELPNGDFAFTIIRQFLFDSYSCFLYEALTKSTNIDLAGIAEKALKEVRYHLRHTSQWILRLGDGTTESHARAEAALNELWRFTPELFVMDDLDNSLLKAGIACNLESLKTPWEALVGQVLTEATLVIPGSASGSKIGFVVSGSRKGSHSEHLGHILAEMQSLPRAYPDAKW